MKYLLYRVFSSFQDELNDYLQIPKNRAKADFFNKIIDEKAREEDLQVVLEELSKYLLEATGKPVWILIDEYDAPLYQAYIHDYYSRAVTFMRTFLGSALKDNSSLHGSVLTGILRIAKESLFSGLNNIVVDSIFNYDYAPYFGFTPEEVQQLLFQNPHSAPPASKLVLSKVSKIWPIP